MTVQNSSSLLDGPEPGPRAETGPELKRCVRCGRVGIRLFADTRDGTTCLAVAACTDRQRQQQPAKPLR
ncbi:hypothetical protein ACFVQ9_34900 [Streptomyces goshikiensis]|uniref:hypothetical protein n=1 Tax=Streptomyces goshikiensis TaxID=1942 RepID=UPI00368332B8